MNTFCVLPWIHLATHPHGGTSLCCVTDFKDGAGMSKDGENYYNLKLIINTLKMSYQYDITL